MRLLSVLLLSAAFLTACADSGPSAEPPEGWVAASPTRWYVPGTDTSAAFRDMSTLETMGVVREGSDLVRFAQETLTDIYRTNPEIVDSVFAAEFLPQVEADLPNDENYTQAATGLVNGIKTAFYQRYNHALYQAPEEPLAIPDSLLGASGVITTQVYVDRDNQPVAALLVEGTGTALDQMMMRRAISGTFTDAWVRPTGGKSAGVKIPTWVRISSNYGR